MPEQQMKDKRDRDAYDMIVAHRRQCRLVWTVFALLFVGLLVGYVVELLT